MAYLEYSNIGIMAMAAAVPKRVINNYEYTAYFNKEDVKEVVDFIGVKERRFADESTCASDLCFCAAEKLLVDLAVDKSEIDALIFVSQTPDYRMPATSVLLQHRLNLPQTTMAFDVNLGCSGFVYGLTIAYSFMQQEGIRKVLLLDGETRSKVYSPRDRNTAFMFGDAGVVALITRGEKFAKSCFSLNSDGSRGSLIMVNAGGYRRPSSPETLEYKVVDQYGNMRTEEQGYMNGPDVFNFLIREIPKDIKNLLEKYSIDMAIIDYFVFHQANNYMNEYLVKKLKLDVKKVPSSIVKYGNTSSVSIPLTIVSELRGQLNSRKKVLLCGFGVGMSWATAVINLDGCYISTIVEV